MGIVRKQKQEIERLNGKINALKRMCNSRDIELMKARAEEAAAEQLIKILIVKCGGRVEVEEREWREYSGMEVVATTHPEKNTREFRIKETEQQ